MVLLIIKEPLALMVRVAVRLSQDSDWISQSDTRSTNNYTNSSYFLLPRDFAKIVLLDDFAKIVAPRQFNQNSFARIISQHQQTTLQYYYISNTKGERSVYVYCVNNTAGPSGREADIWKKCYAPIASNL